MSRLKDVFLALLSIAFTPFVIFVSTSNRLYVINRTELGNNYSVVHPFLWAFAVVTALGVVLYLLSGNRVARWALWLYYLAGPFFIVYFTLRGAGVGFLEGPLGLAAGLVVLFAITTALALKASYRKAAVFFAVFLVLFAAQDVYSFSKALSATPVERPKTPVVQKSVPEGQGPPNVYLLIFDEYQTDMFDLTLTPEIKAALGGFTYYPENTTLFGRTMMSIPSMFTGLTYDFKTPQARFREKLNSEDSITYMLRGAGYSEFAYITYTLRHFHFALFDRVTESEMKGVFIPYSAFRELWVYSNLPLFISERVLGTERVGQIKVRNFLPYDLTLSAYKMFTRYLDEEKDLPGSGRFTFVHAFLPHFPYIFDEECGLPEEIKDGDPVAQAKCTTRLMVKFVETLKELGRYEDSLIIICADHGARFVVNRGGLVDVEHLGLYSPEWSMARARALLLVKPPGASEAFRVSGFESSLLDVAPTIAEAVSRGSERVFEGTSLLSALPEGRRTRRYYFFDKKGPIEWTDEMTAFTIEGRRIRKDGVIKLENNPPNIRR